MLHYVSVVPTINPNTGENEKSVQSEFTKIIRKHVDLY